MPIRNFFASLLFLCITIYSHAQRKPYSFYLGEVKGVTKQKFDQEKYPVRIIGLKKLTESKNLIEIRLFEQDTRFCYTICTILYMDSMNKFHIEQKFAMDKCKENIDYFNKDAIQLLNPDSVFFELTRNSIFSLASQKQVVKSYSPVFLQNDSLRYFKYSDYYLKTLTYTVEFKVENLFNRYSFQAPYYSNIIFDDNLFLKAYKNIVLLMSPGIKLE